MSQAERYYQRMLGGLQQLEKKLPSFVDVSADVAELRQEIEALQPLLPTEKGDYFGEGDVEEIQEAQGFVHKPVDILQRCGSVPNDFKSGAMTIRKMATSSFNSVGDEADKQLLVIAKKLGGIAYHVIKASSDVGNNTFVDTFLRLDGEFYDSVYG